jgi:hypothetical protein
MQKNFIGFRTRSQPLRRQFLRFSTSSPQIGTTNKIVRWKDIEFNYILMMFFFVDVHRSQTTRVQITHCRK